MIEIKNLTKVYKVKNRNDVTAINDVNLVLPDKGMVFIVGKSGSGKSTLLNMLGGLDKPTSGEIIADGNVITKMKKYELTRFRSSYLGFIFQDYHVLDRLTVKQNIELSLDINNEQNDEKVKKLIQLVDLGGLEERYPRELSGGQKQRIAVARALVKDAKVILCDEPTGNLDKKTTTQVLDLLKKISEEKLVIIVSHSTVDANNYGDRIIELYDGKIFRDRERSKEYSNEFKIENNTVYLPHYNDLTPNELILVNEAIENNRNLKFKQIGNRFHESKLEATEHEKVELRKSKITKKGSSKLYKMFFKKKLGLVFSIIVISLLLVCFAIFQSFLNFDGNSELSKSLEKHSITSVPLQKGSQNSEGNLSISTLERVTEDDINKFRESGYTDPIYVKYNNTLPIRSMTIDVEGSISVSSHFPLLYCTETFGTINCNPSMLIDFLKKYGGKDELEYFNVVDTPKDYGVYITDFVADSIGFYLQKDYDSILGDFTYQNISYGYINGIIKTGYKEKYKVLFNEIDNHDVNSGAQTLQKLKDTEEYSDFLVDAINFLAYGYSFAEDYSLTINNSEFRKILRINHFNMNIDEEKSVNITAYKTFIHNETLKENEIVFSQSVYNTLFGTAYTTKTFVPHDITFTFYKNDDKNGEVEYQKTYTITKLTSNTSGYINIDLCPELRQYDVIKYGIYLSSHNDISKMINIATENNFVISNADATKLSTINRVLEIFGKFFTFIELFFLLVTIIFIINTGKASVKKNKYEIGVLKALGVSNFSIIKQFIKQSLILCFLLCVVSNIGIYFGTMVGNSILVKAFEVILEAKFYDLVLINYIPSLVIRDLIYIGIIAIVSFIIPQIMLLRIRPIEIIRARE